MRGRGVWYVHSTSCQNKQQDLAEHLWKIEVFLFSWWILWFLLLSLFFVSLVYGILRLIDWQICEAYCCPVTSAGWPDRGFTQYPVELENILAMVKWVCMIYYCFFFFSLLFSFFANCWTTNFYPINLLLENQFTEDNSLWFTYEMNWPIGAVEDAHS